MKKISAFAIALALAAVLAPAAAYADEAALTAGADALATGVNTADAQTVYYGGDRWYVIGYNDSGVASSSGTATLLAAKNRGLTKYDPVTYSNAYGTSALKTQVEAVASGFAAGESAAVVARDLAGGSANWGQDGYDADKIRGDAVEGALLWPLSVSEANALDSELRKADPADPGSPSSYWWLRSPSLADIYAASVDGDGDVSDIHGNYVDYELGVRPAFNLNLNSVIFTSAAEGGKPSAVGGEIFSAVSGTGSGPWKLTLLNSARQFKLGKVTEASGVYTVEYSGATAGDNEWISAVIEDGSGSVKYYGKVASASASGTVEIDTSGLLADGYTLYVFNEQCNAGAATDYASALVEVVPTVEYTIAVSASPENGGTVSGGGTYTEGESVTLTATPATGYDFASWTEDGAVVPDAGATYTFDAAADRTLVANFELQTFTVTFVDDDGSVLKAAAEYDYGTPAANIAKPSDPTKTATAQYTYKFAGWSPEVADVTADATYTATYEAIPVVAKLTFDLAGGTLDGKTGTITVEANVGDTIKLPAAPTREGYTFKCWKGSEYKAGADYEVKGDHAFTAEWEKNAEPSSDKTDTKPAIPSTGDPLVGMLIPLIALVAASGLCLAFAGAALRRRGNVYSGKHARK